MVLHLHAHPFGAAGSPQDKDAVRPDVVHGVAQQVVQRALHHVRVGIHGQFFVRQLQFELPAVLGADGVVTLTYLVAQLAHVKVHPLTAVGTAGHLAQLHHAGHQRGQAVGLVHDDVHLFVAVGLVIAGQVAHRLGVALDEGQRGAQVVGDVGQQVPLHLGRPLHLLCHMVEVLCKVAQLVAAAALHLHGVVALGHLAGGAGQLPQGLCEPLTEQPRRRHGKDKDQCRRQRQQGAQHVAGLGHMHQTGGHQHGVAAVGCGAAHQKLGRAGQAGRVERLLEAARRGAALLAHGNGGVHHLIAGCVRKIRLM